MMRWVMRIVIMSGMRAGIDWWVRRQERKADAEGLDPQQRQATRENGKRLRQSMRMLRRFIRF